MKIGKYDIEEEDVWQYGWIYILPSIEIQHKHWYLWRVSFSWLKWNYTISIINNNAIKE